MCSERCHCSQPATLCLASSVIPQACGLWVLCCIWYTLFLKCYWLAASSQEQLSDVSRGDYSEEFQESGFVDDEKSATHLRGVGFGNEDQIHFAVGKCALSAE